MASNENHEGQEGQEGEVGKEDSIAHEGEELKEVNAGGEGIEPENANVGQEGKEPEPSNVGQVGFEGKPANVDQEGKEHEENNISQESIEPTSYNIGEERKAFEEAYLGQRGVEPKNDNTGQEDKVPKHISVGQYVKESKHGNVGQEGKMPKENKVRQVDKERKEDLVRSSPTQTYYVVAILYGVSLLGCLVGAILAFALSPKREIGQFTQEQFHVDCLTEHNRLRKEHGAPELQSSDDLRNLSTIAVKQVASNPKKQISENNYGVNHYTRWFLIIRQDINCSVIVQDWYEQYHLYDFSSNNAIAGTEQFTQLMWAETTDIGCAYATDKHRFHGVCFYRKKGNEADKFNGNVPSPLFLPPT